MCRRVPFVYDRMYGMVYTSNTRAGELRYRLIASSVFSGTELTVLVWPCFAMGWQLL